MPTLPMRLRATRRPSPGGVPSRRLTGGRQSAATAVLTDADIHSRLFEAVLGQRLVPGMRLREDELGQAFGVSRTRIRQVLIRLAGEQLVTLVPNVGARVAEPTSAEAREVFDARRLIEPTLLSAFVDRADAAQLKALQAWIVDEERARRDGLRHDAIRMAGGFHLHIAQHAGNQTLARMMRELVPRTSLVLMRFGPQVVRDQDSSGGCDCVEHRTIVSAIKLRDKQAANTAMRRHLDRLELQLQLDAAPAATPALADLLGLQVPRG